MYLAWLPGEFFTREAHDGAILNVNLLSLTIIKRKQRNLEMQFAISQTNVFQSLLQENPCDYEHIFVRDNNRCIPSRL